MVYWLSCHRRKSVKSMCRGQIINEYKSKNTEHGNNVSIHPQKRFIPSFATISIWSSIRKTFDLWQWNPETKLAPCIDQHLPTFTPKNHHHYHWQDDRIKVRLLRAFTMGTSPLDHSGSCLTNPEIFHKNWAVQPTKPFKQPQNLRMFVWVKAAPKKMKGTCRFTLWTTPTGMALGGACQTTNSGECPEKSSSDITYIDLEPKHLKLPNLLAHQPLALKILKHVAMKRRNQAANRSWWPRWGMMSWNRTICPSKKQWTRVKKPR